LGARPHEFDIRRVPRPHVSFGLGNRTCVGLHLARLEIRRTLERALERLPNLRLAPGVAREDVMVRGLGFRSPARLPVVFDPA
jgi:cytochrome P450